MFLILIFVTFFASFPDFLQHGDYSDWRQNPELCQAQVESDLNDDEEEDVVIYIKNILDLQDECGDTVEHENDSKMSIEKVEDSLPCFSVLNHVAEVDWEATNAQEDKDWWRSNSKNLFRCWNYLLDLEQPGNHFFKVLESHYFKIFY